MNSNALEVSSCEMELIQLSFNPGTILDTARTFPQFGKAPWSSCDIKDIAENLTLSVCASDGNNFP